jgi:hypothetical protein
MSGSAPTNNQAVQFEEQQAAQAQQQEAQRQARLQQGQTLIDQIFSGAPVMGTKTGQYDWSTFKPTAFGASPFAGVTAPDPSQTGVPAGYTVAPLPSGGYGLKDASGKVYRPGDPLNVTSQYDTGQRTGGFNDAFYKGYNQKVLDYYQPQEAKQYAESQRDLTYNLARAGTLNSSVAADKTGELAYQDALAKGSIVANANQQTGQLQNQIQANKESLINQLYATEDPTLTANLAESSAKASQLQDPMLTPAAAFFAPAATAVGSVAQSATSPYGLYSPNPTGAPVVQQPVVASADKSSGKMQPGTFT